MAGAYDSALVVLSVLVAILASYAALDLAGRVTDARAGGGAGTRGWLVGGALAMGAGIWSMHFVGMLAFSLPIRLAYDVGLTALSLVYAVAISGLALAVVSRPNLGWRGLLFGGAFMGAGICAMHYTGMAAMRMAPPIHYDPALFAASVLIALVASMAALWLAFTLRARGGLAPRLAAAVVMGLAIAGMHYTAMAAAHFAPGAWCQAVGPGSLSGAGLAYSVGGSVSALLGLTLAGSALDARYARGRDALLASVAQANVELRREIEVRQQAQISLQESEERFRRSLENAPIGMALVSTEGRFLKVNEALCRMVGYAESELLATDFQTITYPDDLAADLGHVADLLAGRMQTYEMEKRYLHKDGRLVWVLLKVSLVRSASGQPLHFVSQILDITQARQMADALKHRTEELERSNRELEHFAYVASHDLQAPLRSINGFVQLLQRRLGSQLDATATEFMAHVVEATQSMQRMIDAILDLARIGRSGAEREPTDMNQAARAAREQLSGLIGERHAELRIGTLPTVTASRQLMVQLLQNLIGNAIKFQPGSAPQVDVSARFDSGEWVFAVKDRGIGIAPEHFHRIFQMFNRLHAAGAFEGSGIGLATCAKIVRLHSGRIWVESEPGRGSTFYFALPAGAALQAVA